MRRDGDFLRPPPSTLAANNAPRLALLGNEKPGLYALPRWINLSQQRRVNLAQQQRPPVGCPAGAQKGCGAQDEGAAGQGEDHSTGTGAQKILRVSVLQYVHIHPAPLEGQSQAVEAEF